MDERELIVNILAGNKNAYRHIVDKYQPMVFRVSMGFVHNKQEADDISQEVFVSAYLSLDKFMGKSTFTTWLYRITVNTCLNHIRNNQKRGIFYRLGEISGSLMIKANPEDNSNNISPDQQLIDKQNSRHVRKAIDNLPVKQKVAFILSKYDELPQQEIAKIMGATEGAVEQLLQRAKANLRRKLEIYYKNNYT